MVLSPRPFAVGMHTIPTLVLLTHAVPQKDRGGQESFKCSILTFEPFVVQGSRQVEEDPEDFGTQGQGVKHRVKLDKEEKSLKSMYHLPLQFTSHLGNTFYSCPGCQCTDSFPAGLSTGSLEAILRFSS